MRDRERLETSALDLCPELHPYGLRVVVSEELPADVRADIDSKGILGCTSGDLCRGLGIIDRHPKPTIFVHTAEIRAEHRDPPRELWRIMLHELGHVLDKSPPYHCAGPSPTLNLDFSPRVECHRLPWVRNLLALGERSRRAGMGTYTPAELLSSYVGSDAIAERFWFAMKAQITGHLHNMEVLKRQPMPIETAIVMRANAGCPADNDCGLPMLTRKLPMLADRDDDLEQAIRRNGYDLLDQDGPRVRKIPLDGRPSYRHPSTIPDREKSASREIPWQYLAGFLQRSGMMMC